MKDIIDAVRHTVRSDPAQSNNMLQVRKWTPLDTAAMYVMIMARRELASGENHIYRGVLSAKGHGYRNVAEHAIKRLIAGGKLSEDAAKIERHEMGQEIAGAG
ncbi:hypothetical protein NOJ05_19665 [Neorhizobium galegae]|uniref:hypothetical protein n=1 Tax=Neorhizobium galegae TaxID=399 RepID=UPI002106655D|nr:hypothetical protein [Neorhizobium galegae]MCQ1779430.1 hypothetical protein [Neorhizobium galegae]MCQ1795590.1 hypothetical protein [Neorhizobium galegae]